jgi:fructosamine-3-kinase
MIELSNPELGWERGPEEPQSTLKEAAARIDCAGLELELLSGGLANTNIRVGREKVLRIYRQDAGRLSKERALLEKGWDHMAVPAVLEAGPDFLVLNYVPHRRLEDRCEHAEAVGRALAEIHSVPYERWGLLDAQLKLKDEFPDLVDSLLVYAASCFEGIGASLAHFREPVLAFLGKQASGMRQAAQGPCLVHSDFKVSNVHWTADGRPFILDWETAYAGSPLSDIGQLFRWKPSPEFSRAFETGYRAGGGRLDPAWRDRAEAFDLINLASLFKDSGPGSRREADLAARVEEILSKC